MTMKSTRTRKPNLLVTLTFFVGAGLLVTTAAQAAEPYNMMSLQHNSTDMNHSDGWWQSMWGLDLARKLKDWRPRITPAVDAEGYNLAHPFGRKGPALQISSALPDSVRRSIRAGGDNGIGSINGDTDAYLFFQKRW